MEWIKCSERMPDVHERGMIFRRGRIRIAQLICTDINNLLDTTRDTFAWDIDGYDLVMHRNEVSHWMPLPEPPKEQA